MSTETRARYSEIGVLTVSHMLNDFYSNYLPQMLPFLIVAIPGFTVTKAAILTAAFSITSSLVQPIFGYLVDNTGRRWLVHVGTLWMAVMLSLTGVVGNYWLLVVLASLAGMGTAAFHPQASSMMNVLSGKYNSGFGLDLMVKDLSIALGIGKDTNTPTPFAAMCREMWASSAQLLGPGQDHTAVAKMSEKLAGVTLSDE